MNLQKETFFFETCKSHLQIILEDLQHLLNMQNSERIILNDIFE